MKDFNIISGIRRSRGFSRGVSFLIIIAIVTLVTERSIYYLLEKNDIIEAENPVERIQQLAPHIANRLGLNADKQKTAPPSTEATFSQTAQGLKETLYKNRNNLDDEQVVKDIDAQLAKLHDQFQSMDQQIMQQFNETQQLITDKQLPEIIQSRQDQAVAHYKKNFRELMDLIEAANNAQNHQAKKQSISNVWAFLSEQKFKRNQQPFDPNNLPNKSLQPDPQNKPKTTIDEFHQAGLYPTPLNKVAALGDFTYDSLPGATNPAYLAATDEVTLSQAIKDQAASLNYDPVTIYHWVRNNIEWQPAWGAVQNADLTLSAKRGNAMDIASLTIALLRASQIPARYVHGTIDVPVAQYMNWMGNFTDINAAANYAASAGIPTTTLISGGQIIKIRMEHVWTEAAIDFHPSRGAKNIDADSWTQFDPSYKQYDYLPGLDVIQISGIDPNQSVTDFTNNSTINETEGWVTGFDPTILQNAQQQTQVALQSYINSSLPSATIGDVLGGRKTIIKRYPTLPSSLPNDIVVTGSQYDKLPAALQQNMSYALGKDILGYPINPISFPWSKLNNERLTLSFKPATAADEKALKSMLPTTDITDISQLPASIPSYLINVIPELKLNGQVIHSGSAMQLGEELEFVTTPKFAGQGALPPRSYNVIAGSFLSVNVIAGSVSSEKLQALQARIAQTESTLEANDQTQTAALTSEELLGDIFYAGTLGYYAQLILLSNIVGIQQGGHNYLSAGYGTIGYEPNVSYFFGIPRAIETGGVVFDIPIIGVATMNDGDAEKRKWFNIQIGILASTLEHATPEKMFATDPNNSPDAISAVKAFIKANAAGQRIYHITQANQATALPNIHHDSATMDEIRNALAVGKEVITHTDAVTVPGWSGAGYIIFDPDSGDGAYKIAGGQNGGWLFLVTVMILLAVIAFWLVTILTGGLTLISGFYGLLALKSYFTYLDDVSNANNYNDLSQASFLAWLRGGLGFLPVFKDLGTLGRILVHTTNIWAAMIASVT